MQSTSFRGLVVASLLFVLPLAGCEGGPASMFGSHSVLRPPPLEAAEAEHREHYVSECDPQALRWLLANRVRQGMTVGDINEILGQDGRREFDDQKLKAGNTIYRADDTTYRWGPDKEGRAYYFIFRDGELLNFDPQEFADEE